jgi:hypothetical protein
MKYLVYNCHTHAPYALCTSEEQAEDLIDLLQSDNINKWDFNTKHDYKEVEDTYKISN